jgi:hypothetical protein
MPLYSGRRQRSTCGTSPHVRLRAECVVELGRADAERAQVVRDHRHVLELRRQFALEPEPGGLGPAKELVRDQAIVHAQPVRELTLGAAHTRKRSDPSSEGDVPVERVADVPGASALGFCSLLLGGVWPRAEVAMNGIVAMQQISASF